MEGLLPSEMVARIASYLSYKGANSLSRTSKTVRAKLETFRNLVPKVPVGICIKTSTDKVELSVGSAPEYGCHVSMIRTVSLIDTHSPTYCLTEGDVRNRIINFYKEVQGEPRHKVMEQSFEQGRLQGLSLHIQMLQTIASIRNVYLDVGHDSTDDIMRILRLEEHSRVEELSIHSPTITTSQLNFIATCNLLHLEVDNSTGSLPTEFYNLPAVRKVGSLYDYSYECTVHDLCSLSAHVISIYGRTNLTLNDVKQFCREWLESKRVIGDIHLNMGNVVSAEEWRTMLEEDNTEPNESGHDRQGLGMDDYNWFLTRPSDGETLIFRSFADNSIQLTSYL